MSKHAWVVHVGLKRRRRARRRERSKGGSGRRRRGGWWRWRRGRERWVHRVRRRWTGDFAGTPRRRRRRRTRTRWALRVDDGCIWTRRRRWRKSRRLPLLDDAVARHKGRTTKMLRCIRCVSSWRVFPGRVARSKGEHAPNKVYHRRLLIDHVFDLDTARHRFRRRVSIRKFETEVGRDGPAVLKPRFRVGALALARRPVRDRQYRNGRRVRWGQRRRRRIRRGVGWRGWRARRTRKRACVPRCGVVLFADLALRREGSHVWGFALVRDGSFSRPRLSRQPERCAVRAAATTHAAQRQCTGQCARGKKAKGERSTHQRELTRCRAHRRRTRNPRHRRRTLRRSKDSCTSRRSGLRRRGPRCRTASVRARWGRRLSRAFGDLRPRTTLCMRASGSTLRLRDGGRYRRHSCCETRDTETERKRAARRVEGTEAGRSEETGEAFQEAAKTAAQTAEARGVEGKEHKTRTSPSRDTDRWCLRCTSRSPSSIRSSHIRTAPTSGHFHRRNGTCRRVTPRTCALPVSFPDHSAEVAQAGPAGRAPGRPLSPSPYRAQSCLRCTRISGDV